MSLDFSLCREGDIPEVVALVNSAYRGDSSKKGWTTEESLLGGQRTDPEMIAEILRTAGNQIWLARENAELRGLFHLENDGERLFLGMLTVHPELQARGLGRQLLAKAELLARDEWKRDELYMSVISLREELISYYRRRGYKPTGEKKDFPMGNPRFGIPKRSDFHLVLVKKQLL